jgi:diaminopimelate decarboxylase
VNPDVDALTHAHTTTGRAENKFGIAMERAPEIARRVSADGNLEFIGFHIHIGSQLTEVEPYREAVEKALALVERCRSDGLEIEYLNLGGGFGIFYEGGEAVSAKDFADAVVPMLKDSSLKIIMEPGRFIVGNAGILLSRVVFVKKTETKTFVICDAAMNDLIRPVLYGAFHRIRPARPRTSDEIVVDVVGPVCESGDFFAKDRSMPPVKAGDLIAIFSAGAYCFVMSSNFNSRRRACEVLADGDSFSVVRERETYEDLVRLEG